MGQPTPLQFIKGDSIGSETDYRDALPVNMYAVPRKILGADGYMVQNYGLTQFGSSSERSRGGFYNDRQSNHFRVQGNDFIEVDANGVVNVLGAVTGFVAQTDTVPPVSMDYSFNTQAVLADLRFYLFDTGSGFVEVTDPDLGDPIDFVWVDGFYFFTDGEDLYHTELADETSIDPVDFGVAQFMPDGSLGLGKTQDNKVIVFGRFSTEYFVNDGTSAFAFSRIPSRALKFGIVATHCKAELKGKWYIIGGAREENISVYLLTVGGSQKIATREVEKILGTYTEEDFIEASVEIYVKDRINFVQLNLRDQTLIYNELIAEQFGIDNAWSLLKSDTFGTDPYRALYGVFDPRVGNWIFGDRRDGKLALLDDTVSTQYGELAEWILFTPFIYLDSQSIDELEIQTMPGHTTSNDATVFISLTYDGVTFGSEFLSEYGKINDYGKRFIVRRLGYVRDWAGFKIRGASRSRMAFARGFIKHG